MHQDTKTTYISGKPEPRNNRTAPVFAVMFVLLLTPFTRGQQNAISEYNEPQEVKNCLRFLGPGYAISSKINPFYLRGDFNGDGKPDYAVLVRNRNQQGVMLCLGGLPKPTLLGAGAEFNKMQDLNFGAWQVHPKGRRVERGVEESKPPVLLSDAILLEWEESASALVYWNGERFVWYQQGD